MSAKLIYSTEMAFDGQQFASRKVKKGVLARWFAEVLERGQSLRYLESVGGL
jgi:hypothetical protein